MSAKASYRKNYSFVIPSYLIQRESMKQRSWDSIILKHKLTSKNIVKEAINRIAKILVLYNLHLSKLIYIIQDRFSQKDYLLVEQARCTYRDTLSSILRSEIYDQNYL